MPACYGFGRLAYLFLVLSFVTVAAAQEPIPLSSTIVVAPDGNWEPVGEGEYSDCSRWFAGADALWLQRDYPGNFLIARTVDRNANTIPGRMINLSDVSENTLAPGFRAWIGYQFSEDTSVELSYFGLQEWSKNATITVQDPPFAQSPFLGNSIPFANKSFDTTLTVKSESAIHNAELNLTQSFNLGCWKASALSGVRYFQLEESLEITGVEAFITTIEQTRTATRNNLYGAQLGGALSRSWLEDRLVLSLNGKVGIFANDANQQTSNGRRPFDGGAGTPVLLGSKSSTDFASLYEVGVTGTFRLTPNVAVRGGYQVLFLQGLALASDQLLTTGTSIRDFPGTPFPPGTGSGLRTDGNLFLHGPFVGMEISY